MANEKISELPSGAPAQPTDAMVIARGTTNYSYAISQALTGAGGGFDVQIGGNTAGVTGNISTGTLFLAGGNNVTLSQNGNAITISGASLVPSFSAGVSTGGNTSGVTGVTGSQIVFAGGNNITLSQSNNTAGASITISGASIPAQTVQTQNVVDVSLGGNTAGALALISSGTLFLAGGNNVTLSQNGQSITISANTAAAATLSISAGTTSGGFNGITFSNSNGFSWGLNNGTITAAQSIQTQATGLIAGTGFATTTTNGSVILGTLNTAGQTLAVPPYITTQTVQTQNAVDVTLGGNTSGVLALISSGTLFLAGGNNVTLSQNGNSVTISANTAAAATLSVSAGTTSGGFGGITFSNSNNLSFGLNNGTITGNAAEIISAGTTSGSFSGFTLSNSNSMSFGLNTNGIITGSFSQSVQTQAIGNIAGTGLTTTTTGGTALVGTHNTAGLSLGVPAWLTAAPGQFSGGVSNIGNSAGNTGISGTQLVLAGGNNITLSQVTGANGATVTVSGGAQTNQSLGIYASSQTVGQSSSSTVDARSFSYVGKGIVSVGLSAGQLLISGNQTNQTMGIYASSQTTGQSSSTTIDARSFSVVGAGIISVGLSQGTLLISAPGSTGISQSLYATGNTTQSSSGSASIGSILFQGAGNVSVGVSNGSVVISGAGAGGGAGAAPGISTFGNTAGTTGTFSSGTYLLVGTGPITLSQSTNTNGATVSINGPATSSLSGAGGISVSVNASTISVYPNPLTRMIWPQPSDLQALTAPTQGGISVQYVPVNWPVTASRVDALMSWQGASAATTATMGIALSAYCAIFTRNASTLSSLSSGSTQTTYTYASNTAGQTQISQAAIRPISVPVNMSMTPGEYFVAYNFSTNTTSVGASTTNYAQSISMMGGASQTAPNYASEFSAITAASRCLFSGMGVYSVTSAGIGASLALSDIVATGASLSAANIALVFRNG